jgi:hypothetical protein
VGGCIAKQYGLSQQKQLGQVLLNARAWCFLGVSLHGKSCLQLCCKPAHRHRAEKKIGHALHEASAGHLTGTQAQEQEHKHGTSQP